VVLAISQDDLIDILFCYFNFRRWSNPYPSPSSSQLLVAATYCASQGPNNLGPYLLAWRVQVI
jgi:hypothetical protein